MQETFLRMGKMCCHGNNMPTIEGEKHFQIKLGTHVRFEV